MQMKTQSKDITKNPNADIRGKENLSCAQNTFFISEREETSIKTKNFFVYSFFGSYLLTKDSGIKLAA
jgi:hypothetical protein